MGVGTTRTRDAGVRAGVPIARSALIRRDSRHDGPGGVVVLRDGVAEGVTNFKWG